MKEKIKGLPWKKGILMLLTTIIMLTFINWIIDQRTEWYNQSSQPVADGTLMALQNFDIYTQNVICEKDSLEGISVYARLLGVQQNAELLIRVYDGNDVVICEKNVTLSNGAENSYATVLFEEPITGVKNESFKIEYTSNLDADSWIELQGCQRDTVLCNDENNMYTRLIYKILDAELFRKIVLAASVFVWIVLAGVICFIVKKDYKAERIFAVLYLVFGIFYLMSLPLSGVPDEQAHMRRIYDISKGTLVVPVSENGMAGDHLPANLLDNWKEFDMRILDIIEGKDFELSKEERYMTMVGSALYSPLTYTPQAIGVSIGRLLSNNGFVVGYMGRIANWLVIGLILFYSIRYIPFGKNIIIVISMISMNMQENVSLAADGFTYAVVIAFISYVLYMRYDKKGAMSIAEKALLYILLIYVASCKIVYMPICVLAFLIPAERFGGIKRYYKNAVAAAAVVLTVSLGWLLYSSRYMVEFLEGVDVGTQVMNILINPLGYIGVIVNTIFTYGSGYIESMLGARLGMYNITNNAFITYLIMIILVYTSIKERNVWKSEEGVAAKRLMVFSYVCIFLLICTSLYAQWTTVGKNIIEGIQGRYFLPILFPFILTLKRPHGGEMLDNTDNVDGMLSSYLLLTIYSILVVVTLLTYNII